MPKAPLHLARGLAVAALLACGEDSDGSDPVAQCNTLITALCERAITCIEAQTDSKLPEGTMDDCVETSSEVAPDRRCEDAVGVSARYDECLSTTRSIRCEELVSIGEDGEPELTLIDACRQAVQVD